MRAARFIGFLLALATLLFVVPSRAAEWTPPELHGHVVDAAGVLTGDQILRLDAKLDRARRDKGFAIVVYLLAELPEGVPIEDVAYKAFNAWKVGSAKGDDGVLLVATTTDRHLRIETGKGVGGALTDIQSSHVSREVVGPLMREQRYYEAMNRGTDAILRELVANTEGGKSEVGRDKRQRAGTVPPLVKTIGLGVVLLLVIVLAIVSPTFREIL